MNPALIVTVAGPILGASGWFTQTMWLFWLGVVACVITLFFNVLASGVMKLPVLPVLFMAASAILLSPWYVGLGAGLIAWTALEFVGDIVGLCKVGRPLARTPLSVSTATRDSSLDVPMSSCLTADFVSRVKTVKSLVDEVFPKSIEDWLEGFELDRSAERELLVWECMAYTYAAFIEGRDLSLEQKKEALNVVLNCSLGRSEAAVLSQSHKHLGPTDTKEIFDRYFSTAESIYALQQHRTGG